MKAILKTFKPREASQILNGEKTIIIMTKAPTLTPPFDMYVFETLGKIIKTKGDYGIWKEDENGNLYESGFINKGRGKVVAKATVEKVGIIYGMDIVDYYIKDSPIQLSNINQVVKNIDNICSKLKISFDELWEKSRGNDLYALHISNLEIFDEPKEIGEFYKPRINYEQQTPYPLTKPPKNWCYVEI